MPRAVWILIIGMAVNTTGASFLWPLNTIYLTQELNQTLTVAGFVLMCNSGAGVVGNLIGGKLFDRTGGVPAIISGVAIAMGSAFLLAFFHHSLPAYIALLMGIGFGGGMLVPCMYAMAGSVWPEGGRRPFNAMYVSQNVGIAIGAAAGGFLASYRFDLVFIGNGIMYLVFFLVAYFSFRNMQGNAGTTSSVIDVPEQAQVVENNKRFTALLILCAGFFVCWLAYSQWPSTISVHTQTLGISLNQYSILWTINGAMIVFCQPLIKFFIQHRVHSLKAQIYTGTAIFILAYAVLTQAGVFTAFVAAMVILTIGEMFVWPAIPTIAHHLAPNGKAGFYQGIVNSVGTGGRLIGPLFGGVLADLYGMSALFYVLTVLLLVPIGTTAFFDKNIPEQQFSKKETEASA
ncbi:Predicted arabinose efflux permease, MFS family [Evansella caseinilytica]|uniref:Predicted arabinose efflux permease, MFS family n=1 Tax=Evansella caseinilytica TaxID=1503961 RepID=A0A1H3RXV9_9BACI|nr:MFS transporter [Evansella caseinilytica]SDZ29699.1 Predicted arabinose efflux permease, MFS family [Evansella caseinilytica]